MNKSLNTFRTFAFLAVFLFHAGIAPFGYLGVYAFFVLSGYLITPIILKTKSHTSSLKEFLINFYGRRAFRIFPPYYLYLAIISLIILLFSLSKVSFFSDFISQLPWAVTYTYDFYHSTVYFVHNSLVSHFWSLAVEEQFYILWPLVLFITPHHMLKKVFLFLIILGPIIRFFTGLMIDSNSFEVLSQQKDVVIYVLPFSHIDAFVMGGFFSMFFREFTPSNKVLLALLSSIIFFGLLTTKLVTGHFDFLTLGYGPFMLDSYKYLWGYTLFGIFFSLLLLRLNKRNFWPRIFENNILAYLGKISYGLYIYHFAILFFVERLLANVFEFADHKTVFQKLAIAALSFILTIIISIVSFEFFEKYTLFWKDKYFPKEKKS